MNETVARGFASMTAERRKEIAAMGGRAVPKYKRTFRKNRALAKAAGSKGGSNVPAEKRSFSCDRTLARSAGCIGGKGTSRKKRAFVRIKGLAQRAGALGRHARAYKNNPVAQTAGDQALIDNALLEPIGDDRRAEPPARTER